MDLKDTGGEKQFREYFEKYYKQVFTFILKKGIQYQTAEDLAMESFLSCWANFKDFDSQKASFSTWLYVVVKNKIKNYCRDKKEHTELKDDFGSAAKLQDDFVEAMQLNFLRGHLAVALEKLNEAQRRIVIYKYFKGKKSNEIALLIGTTPGNVRVQLKRAMDKLKAYFLNNNIRWE